MESITQKEKKEYEKDLKDFLIMKSIEDQIPIDEVISNLLKDFLAKNSITQ